MPTLWSNIFSTSSLDISSSITASLGKRRLLLCCVSKEYLTPSQLLRHPTSDSLLKLFRVHSFGTRLQPDLKSKIIAVTNSCGACARHAELPRIPKLSLPPHATPNIAATLDVMHHFVNHHKASILVMLDVGDKLIWLSPIRDHSASATFKAYLWRWISIFDAPTYTVVNQGSNFSSSHMHSMLLMFSSQLCPIPTEAPWSIGDNERSHKFISKYTDILQSTSEFDCGPEDHFLLAEIEMAWNFNQNQNRELPHFNLFGIMPCALGETPNSTMQHRIAFMESCRVNIEQARASRTFSRVFNSFHRYYITLRVFTSNQKVWFYRKNSG